MMSEFRLIDHTGDMGFEVSGTDAADLFGRAGWVLLSLLADLSTVKEGSGFEIEAEGHDLEELLVSFLGEILYLHDAKDLVFRRVEVLSGPDKTVKAALYGEEFDPERHTILRQIKAVTYHGISVKETGGRWAARVILDI